MPRKKQADFNEEPEEVFEWDKTRIVMFFVVLGVLVVGGFLAKHFFLDAQSGSANGTSQSVQGISSSPSDNSSSQLPSVQSIRQSAQQEMQTLQKQASQISVQEIASSSPQVQQVLEQLKQLPNVPGNVAKQTCVNLCNNL